MKHKITLAIFLFLLIGITKPQSTHTTKEQLKYLEIADSLKQLKQFDQSIIYLKKAYDLNPNGEYGDHTIQEELGYYYVFTDSLVQAEKLLKGVIKNGTATEGAYYDLACIRFRLNDIDTGLYYLEESFNKGYINYEGLEEDHDLDPVRNNRKYKLLMERYFSKKQRKIIDLTEKALDYYFNKNYKKAAKLFVKAGKNEEKSKNTIPIRVYINYFWASLSYSQLDQYKKIIKYKEKYNKYVLSVSDTIEYADNLNHIGILYALDKDYDNAIENYEKALDLYIQINDSSKIGEISDNIGDCFYVWLRDPSGDWDDNMDIAAKYYEQAYNYGHWQNNDDISELLEEIGIIALSYLNQMNFDKMLYWADIGFQLATDKEAYGERAMFCFLVGVPLIGIDPDNSLVYLEETFDYFEKNPDNEFDIDGSISLACYIYLSMTYVVTGDFSSFEEINSKGFEFVNEKNINTPQADYIRGGFFQNNKEFDLSNEYFNKVVKNTKKNDSWYTLVPLSAVQISNNYLINRQFSEAYENSLKALDISYKSKNQNGIMQSYVLLYLLSYINNDLDKQINYLEDLVFYIDSMPSFTTKYQEQRFDQLLAYYEMLSTIYLFKDNPVSAIKTIEVSKSRILKDKLGYEQGGFDISALIRENEAIITIEEINSSFHPLYKSSEDFGHYTVEIDKIMDETGNNTEFEIFDMLFTYIIDDSSYYWTFSEKDTSILRGNIQDLKTLAKVYHYTLKNISNRQNNNIQLNEISKSLYNLLLRELPESIEQKKRWIFVLDPILMNFPIETLTDSTGTYLVEKYDISYVPSLTVLSLLQQREYNNDEDHLLAFGGPEYNSVTFEEVSQDEIDHMFNLRSINSKLSYRDIYGSLGYYNWNELPGSLKEVNDIIKYFPQHKLFTGDDVNEENLKSLSNSGELADYNLLHFATHGLIIPDIPKLSALVLSQNDQEDNVEDGYLTIDEISTLKLKADFVNLSACETGLGKVYAGEGVVGMTHAFIIAGANGLGVSLWPVSDNSTAIFMNSLYEKIANDVSYYSAFSQTKREFISGKYGEKYKDPYYWAPFVYYGK